MRRDKRNPNGVGRLLENIGLCEPGTVSREAGNTAVKMFSILMSQRNRNKWLAKKAQSSPFS